MSSSLRTLLAATLLAATATTATAAGAAGPEWIRQFGTTASDLAFGVATGPDGRVHVVGLTWGSFGGVAQGPRDVLVITFDGDGRELWRRQPGTTGLDSATAVTADADGNVYVVGVTSGALGGTNKGYDDAFVIKFDRDGRIVWKRQPGTTSYETALGVTTDADGNVYVVGATPGALGGAKKGSLYDQDAFVIKYDRDGRIVWKRQPGTTNADYASGVATDADGNVYVVGLTNGALGGTSKGRWDAFVIKFERDGRIVWKRQPGTTKGDTTRGVATDADGNVYVVGYTLLANVGPTRVNPFVIKFDRDGRTVWKRQPGTTTNAQGYGVATDADGNVYVVGSTDGALGGTHKGDEDAFVIKYDRDGRTVWKRQPGTYGWDYATGVTTDADGNVYVVGRTSGSLGGTNKGEDDAFLIKYGPNGPQ